MKTKKILSEGAVTNTIFRTRFANNKNVLLSVTGSTGSGKSYSCLRIAEIWYETKFHKKFPIENVTFSNGETMKRLSSGNMEKGELLVVEEIGVNMGALDYQNKTSKMMNYTLQSFRSMNVGLIMNLPVLTMLNKSARQLLHAHLVTTSIDYKEKKVKLKPFMHQLNQYSGKSYWKYPKLLVDGRWTKVYKIAIGMPSPELVRAYEEKKAKFLLDLTQDYAKEFEQIERDKIAKMSRCGLTDTQLKVFNLLKKGLNVHEVAKERGCKVRSIYTVIEGMRKRGYDIDLNKLASARAPDNIINKNEECVKC